MQGPYRTYYANGLLQWDANYKDGKLDGFATEYGEDGKQKRQITYKDGLPDGPMTFWYSSGPILSVELLQKGQRNGAVVYYYPDGRKAAEGQFEHRLPVGHWEMWDDSGKVIALGNFVDGHPAGKWLLVVNGKTEDKVFDPENSSCQGGGTAIGAAPPMNLMYRCQRRIANGRLKGHSIDWYPSGQKMDEVDYIQQSNNPEDLVVNGPETDWFENGHIKDKAIFDHGKLNGAYSAYYDTGQLKRTATYKDGQVDGTEKQWSPAGELWAEYNYRDGKLDGEQRVWNEDGDLIRDEIYANGELKKKVK